LNTRPEYRPQVTKYAKEEGRRGIADNASRIVQEACLAIYRGWFERVLPPAKFVKRILGRKGLILFTEALRDFLFRVRPNGKYRNILHRKSLAFLP
jgi:hypothetical protein